MKPRDLLAVAYGTALLLLVPLVAMQFTNEVAWGLGDFFVAALLLFSAGLGMLWAVRNLRGPRRKWAVVAAIGVLLALVWAELAVGILR